MLIKYPHNYNFLVFYFVSLEAGTVAFKIFCVMIPSLVDTSLDFGLFRVVRPYIDADQSDFKLRPLECKKVRTVQIGLKSVPSFTDQTYTISTPCIPARLL